MPTPAPTAIGYDEPRQRRRARGRRPPDNRGFGQRACALVSSLLLGLCCVMPAGAALLEYHEYLQRADASRQRGDWQSVASQLAQAINHPDRPSDAARHGRLLLEYGRAVGVMCQFTEAERYLHMAAEVSSRPSLVPAEALLELGTMAAARKQHDTAIGYFQRALAAGAASADKAQARLMLQAHERMAAAMRAAGRGAEAETHGGQAISMRSAGPAGGAVEVPATPYASRCPKT